MSERKKRKHAAIEAVARHFCTTWEIGEHPADVHIAIAGKRVGLQVTTIEHHGGPARLGLRFDRVAMRLIGGLRDALHEPVPDGCTVILTVTAPIRLPSKTAGALKEKVRFCLAHAPARVAIDDTIHANRVRIRLVEHACGGAAKLVGFVHNADVDAELLLDLPRSLLECVGAAAAGDDDRWLIIAAEAPPAHIQAYRHAWSQLAIPTGFAKVLLVLPDGQVEPLSG